MSTTKIKEENAAWVIEDETLTSLLSDETFDNIEVLPCVPDDAKEFEEDVKGAMNRLKKEGKYFEEETKQKFRLWQKREVK